MKTRKTSLKNRILSVTMSLLMVLCMFPCSFYSTVYAEEQGMQNEDGTENETESETAAETEIEAETDTETAAEAENEAETGVKTDAEIKTETGSEAATGDDVVTSDCYNVYVSTLLENGTVEINGGYISVTDVIASEKDAVLSGADTGSVIGRNYEFKAGEEVSFVVAHDEDYEVDKLEVIDSLGVVVDFDYDEAKYKGTFTMPLSDVQIEASFVSEADRLNALVRELQARIDSLPAVDEYEALSESEKEEIYNTASDICDDYYDLIDKYEDAEDMIDAERLFDILDAAITVTLMADTDTYAILYDTGELVFQDGDVPDDTKGTVLGTYFVKLSGYLSYEAIPWYSQREVITSVSFANPVKPTSIAYWFYGCKNLTSINSDNLDTSNVTSMTYTFFCCSSLTDLDDLSGWETGNVKSLYFTFNGCRALTNVDGLSGWDTGNLIGSLYYTFTNCSALTNVDGLSGWKTGNVTELIYTFSGCSSLTNVDGLSGWETGSVTSLASTFNGCSSLTNVDGLSDWETGSVTSLASTFNGCSSLTNVDGLSGWETGSVKSLASTFLGCSTLTNVDGLSGWETRSVTSLATTFYGCSALTNVDDLSGWETGNVTSLGSTFSGCRALTNIDGLLGWKTGSVTSLSSTFSGCSALTNVDGLSGWDTSRVGNLSSTFSGCSALTDLDGISGWETGNVTSLKNTFSNCSSLINVDGISGWETGNVTSLESTFSGCSALTDLDGLSGWKTGNVTSLSTTFKCCSSITDLDGLSGWETGNVTTLYGTFAGCSAITDLDGLSGWETENVTTLALTFSECSTLTNVDGISGWETGNVTTLGSTFYSCSALTDLEGISGWKTGNVTSLSTTFRGCSTLTNVDSISDWETGNVTNLIDTFKGCISLTNVDGLSGWDTSRLVNLSNTFSGCSALTNVDGLSGWDTSRLGNLSTTFLNCSSLTNVDGLSGWDTSGVTTLSNIFDGCSSLESADLSSWDTSNVINMSYIFRYCNKLKKLVLGEKFKFLGAYSSGSFPTITWIRKSTGDVYTSSELWNQYDGQTMADTYLIFRDITFNAMGGVPGNIVKAYPYEAEFEGQPVTRTGYTFDGWYTDVRSGEELKIGDQMVQDTYYAHWTPITYALTIKPNLSFSGLDDIVVSLAYDETYHISDTVFSYTPAEGDEELVISSWNTRKDGTGTSYDANSDLIALTDEDGGEVILYAQWRAESDYAILSFDTNGGSEIDSIKKEKGTVINYLPEPVRDGYTFISWHIGSEAGAKVTKVTLNDDITLVAEWKRNLVVTLEGGIQSIQKVVGYNKAVGQLPDYAQGSYNNMTFTGWYTLPDGGTQVTSATKVTEDVTFYAHWGWKPKFNANGGKITGNSNYPVSDSENYVIETLPVAERDGYELIGWFLSDGVTPVNVGDTIDLSLGIEIVAHWKRSDVVAVTFDANGGYIISSTINTKTINVFKGETTMGFPVPTRSGYDFLGWTDADGNSYDEATAVFNEDITLYAQWGYKNCTVTFDPSSSVGTGTINSTSKTKTVQSGSTLNTLPGAKLTNYILEGWYTEADGQGEKLTTDTVITENITYYAYYIPSSATYTDDKFMYNFTAEWSNASNTNVDNLDDNLEFHPASNSSQIASLHIRFELNKSIGDEILPVGSVKIRIPKYVWKNWDGEYVGTNNISSNLPKYPSVKNGMYFSYYEDGDDYVLINSVQIPGGAGVDCTISYTVSPWVVPGGATDTNGYYVEGYDYYQGTVPVVALIDEDLNDTPETTISKDLTLEMHTKVVPSSTKSTEDVYYQWNTSWGSAPDDADDYFYIRWRLSESFLSSTNQPCTFIWSEDTVHDGTIVCWGNGNDNPTEHSISSSTSSTDYVVMKYPIELLYDIPEEGLTIYNEAIVSETWKSGYKTARHVSASTVLYDQEYPKGEFDKNNGSSSAKTISGGQENILDDNKAVSMFWDVIYEGASRDSEVTWDEIGQTYSVDSRTIMFEDGVPGDLVYSSGSASAKYIWEPVTGNVALTDSDYSFTSLQISVSEYDSRKLNGVWLEPSLHTDAADYEGVRIYLRYRNSSEFVYYKMVNVTSAGSSLTVTLPDDVVGYRVEYPTVFYTTKLTVRVNTNLLPTDHVRGLIQSDVNGKTTSLIKNRAVCRIWDTDKTETDSFFEATDYTGGTNSAAKEIYELNISSTTQKTYKYTASESKTVFDVERGTQDTAVYIAGYNYNNSGRKKQVRSGVFYDLLPRGTTVDESTIFGIPLTTNRSSVYNYADSYSTYAASTSKLDKGLYDVSFVDNWEDSGRTMMIITFASPDDTVWTGVQFWYMLHNTYENVVDNGTTVENDVAFVNTTTGAVIPNSKASSINVIKENQYYEAIYDKNPNFTSFSAASTHYIPVDAFSWGFDKSVKTQAEYEHSAETIPNNEYTYKLSYSQSDYAISSDIVFFDILEYGADRNNDDNTETVFCESEWHGTLVNVDVESASSKYTYDKELQEISTDVKCAPVIYYSTKDRAAFAASDYDITNTDTWTTEKPVNAESITAIAVDCSKNSDGSDFVMQGRDIIEIYVTMKAPVGEEYYGKKAINEGVIYSLKNDDEVSTPNYSDSDVTLTDSEPELHKSSDPESGTHEKHTQVFMDDVINYTISVKNTGDTFTLKDIAVEDNIPEGLLIDTANITVRFDAGTELKVKDSPRVSLDKTGQKLVFDISTLLPEETVYITIPATVTISRGIIDNTSYITSVNGVDKNIESETTHHEASPSSLPDTGTVGLIVLIAVALCIVIIALVLRKRSDKDSDGKKKE
ncbi:MAG: BspA family leucine-rich repeat surface protein [Coprococcus sp.]